MAKNKFKLSKGMKRPPPPAERTRIAKKMAKGPGTAAEKLAIRKAFFGF